MERVLSGRTVLGLSRAAEAVLGTQDLDALLLEVLEAARESIPAADKGSILFWDEVFQILHVSHAVGYEDPRALKTTFPVTRGYAARCARQRKPVLIADARLDAEIRYDGDIEEMRAVRSAVAAPLVARDRLLGVISMDAVTPEAFDDDDCAVLGIVAGLTALALDNSRLSRDLERQVQERTAALSSANAELATALAERDKLVDGLTDALSRVKTLSGLLPICASCKKVRDDGGYWNQLESYLRAHTDTEVSHGICPDCIRRLYPEQAAKVLIQD
jgi:GAF domain-containing protein